MPTRFLLMADVAEQLNVSPSQVYHMVRSGELPAIKIGGRGQWRIEVSKLEEYISRKYLETADWVRNNPLGSAEATDDPDGPDVGTPEPSEPSEPPEPPRIPVGGRPRKNTSKRN